MNSNTGLKSMLRSILLVCVCAGLAFGAGIDKEKQTALDKTSGNDLYRPFLINNVFNYYGNNGDGSFNKYSTDNEGFEFYKGQGKHVIFEDGVVWGGYHKGRATAKVGGSVYRHGLQAGKILTNGTATTDPTAEDAGLAKNRVYRVRPDINPNTAFSAVEAKINSEEVAFIGRYESYTAQEIYDQYIKDWNEWPALEGAPYTDVDGNGSYDPTKDIPGQPGSDQTLWYVANDMGVSRTNNLAGSPPIGLEMQRTIWGYKRSGALGNTIFASTLLINKSGAPIDTMYLVQWSDPDLGNAGDDYAGCDTTRSLGYIYNGGPSDATYGVKVPAGGFDFFQGPIVPGAPTDTAIFRLKYRPGYKNLPMTTFVFFTQGFATYADPTQGPGGDIEWYRLMKGTVAKTGAPFIDPNTNQPTVFTLAGDPVKATDGSAGWVDGQAGLTPQDRRICMVTGPFTMAVGDTQELVVANLAGLGADRLSSISAMRTVSDQAQQAYNSLFDLPSPPPAPQIEVAELDGEVVLTWGDPQSIAATEGTVDQGFEFEGYKLWEFPGPSPTDAILLGQYDLVNGITVIADTVRDAETGLDFPVVLQKGTDSGLIREIKLSSSKVTGTRLINGTSYYFSVTAYSYNPYPPAAAGTHSLESSPSILTVVPQTTVPGVRLPKNYGDTLTVTRLSGSSDGAALASVVNPTALTGAQYKIVFGTSGGQNVWHVIRTMGTKVDTVAKNQTDQTGTESIIIDGISFSVTGAPNDFKDFLTVSNAAGPLNPPEYGAFAFNASEFPHPTTADRPTGSRQQTTATISGGWGIHTGMNSPTMDFHYPFFVTRVTQGGARWPRIVPYDFEIRFTAAGGKALIPAAFTGTDLIVDVPFELWNIGINTPTNTSDDYRLFPYVLDVDNSGTFNMLTKAGTDTVDNGGGGADHVISGGTDDPFTDWIYWVRPIDKSPGQAGYNAILSSATSIVAGGGDPYLDPTTTDGDVMRRMVLVLWNGGQVAAGTYQMNMPEAGTTFRIISTKPNTPADAFAVQAPTVQQSLELAKQDVGMVNVYPNPYIGFNTAEINRYARFVTFSHLPQKATVRVFNLAGVLVRTLAKNDPGQYLTWDLNNESGFPVSAGMYIAYVDMPDVGVTKILKMAIIPEQQYLDRW